MKRAVAIAYTVCMLTPAFAGELYIRPDRESLHVGESISCKLHFKREYARHGHRTQWKNWKPSYGAIFSFSFRPEKPGRQEVGPVSITIGDETVRADAIPIVVLPDMGTNDLFEIRIYDDEITKNETVEVVVQWHRLKRVPNPYYKADRFESHPFHLTKLEETDDWKLRPRYRNKLGGRSGEDERGHYIIEGRLEVYEFIPKRTGRLRITKDLFRNLPSDYRFETRMIIVTE